MKKSIVDIQTGKKIDVKEWVGKKGEPESVSFYVDPVDGKLTYKTTGALSPEFLTYIYLCAHDLMKRQFCWEVVTPK